MHSRRVGFLKAVRAASAYLGFTNSASTPPVAYQSSGVQGAPRWRHYVQETPVDPTGLFPLHNPLNYVRWLGTQKKRLVVLAATEAAVGPRYGAGEDGGLRGSLRSRE